MGLSGSQGFCRMSTRSTTLCGRGQPDTGVATTYGEMRLFEEEQFSAYGFDYADVEKLWEHLRLYEAECLTLLKKAEGFAEMDELTLKRFPVLGAYELALKCSQMFNLLDARGAISVTERVGVMGRIRTLVVGVAKAYAAQEAALASRKEDLVVRG